MSKTKKILSSMTIVWLCLLLVVFTYSWVLRNRTPVISQDDLQISSAGALVINLMGDGNYDSVDLNKVTGHKSFVFKQVSSLNGKNFLRLDFTPTIEGKSAVYEYIDENNSHKEDYIDARFALKLDDSLKCAKYVYLHEDCMISDNNDAVDVDKAIRIALDYDVKISDTEKENHTYIFGVTENGALEKYGEAVKPDSGGLEETDVGAVGQQTVYSFAKFNGLTDGKPDPEKCLFRIEPGEIMWINLRIWLEGADENCRDELAGESFNLTLKFDSVEETAVAEAE